MFMYGKLLFMMMTSNFISCSVYTVLVEFFQKTLVLPVSFYN